MKSQNYNKNLIVKGLPHSQQIAINLYFDAAPKYESKKQSGYAHFLEHMLLEGSETHTDSMEISNKIDSLGGYLNAYTYPEFTVLEISVYYEEVKEAFSLLSELAYKPIFDKKGIEKEKKKIILEISRFEDNLDNLSYALLRQKIAAPSSLSVGVSNLGTRESVKSVDRESLIEFHQKFYNKEQARLSIAGNISKLNDSDIKKVIDKSYKKTKSTAYELKPGKGYTHKVKEANSTYLKFAFWSKQDLKDYHMQLLHAQYLSLKMEEVFRNQRGSAYVASAYLSEILDKDYIEVQLEVDHKEINYSVEKVKEIITDKKVDKELFKSAKGRMVHKYLLDKPMDIADHNGLMMVRNLLKQPPQKFINFARNVSLKELEEFNIKFLSKLESNWVCISV